MKEIIVNSAEDKNTIILVENGKLLEKYEEYDSLQRLEGNIYIGKVTDILPGMQAAFVDIGDDKNAFLHIKDILPKVSNQTGNKHEDLNKYNIKDYVKVGMPVIVEVKKDKTDKKGAKVSTNLNIAGNFVVIIPNTEFVTVSQKIEDEEEARRLSNIISNLNIKNYGIIIRTSAVNATEFQIKEDIENVIKIYENVTKQAEELTKNNKFEPTLLFEKGNILKRLLLDVGNQGLNNIIVNNELTYKNAVELVKDFNINVEVKYVEKESLLDLYDLHKQINKISNRKIWLDCGGFITIDQTEALTAIDVNTGKFIGKENIEKTVLKVNSEATVEIAKQIRARDIGGIVIIDYIDMDSKEDEEIIQNLLIENLKKDRAKTQVVGFTKLHLLEMTRKHICS
ncbi:MAG: Rne/Rng family ribonuclease [Clostridia bacterium]|nr:Rne/Rng family ribonuclease [Clostridia bacterium]